MNNSSAVKKIATQSEKQYTATTVYCALMSLEPGYLDWVGDFFFWYNLFAHPSPPNCYLFLRLFPLPSFWSYRLNHPLATVELLGTVQPLSDYTSLATIYVNDFEVQRM